MSLILSWSTQGVSYTTKMKTGWKLPGKLRVLSEEDKQAICDKFHILVEGSELPAAVTRFEDLKLPGCILDTLKAKGISKPTPIQMQVDFFSFSSENMGICCLQFL